MSRSCRSALVVAALAAGAMASSARGQESWDAIYMGGSKVGYSHVHVEPLKDKAGNAVTRVRVDLDLTLQRDRDRTHLRLMYGTIEKPDGTVLRLDTRTRQADQDIRTYGDVEGGKMKLTLEVGGNVQHLTIPWGDDVRGPYAAELSLSRSPMKPGDKREVRTFLPVDNKVALTKLAAVGVEPVAIGVKGDKRDLLRVEQDVFDDSGKPIPGNKATLWVDGSGQILKSHIDMLNAETFRTTKAGAMAENGQAFNLTAASIVPSRKIDNYERAREIVYKVSSVDGDPASIFVADRRQSLAPGDAKAGAILTVKTAGPNDGSPSEAPGPEFLKANPLITSQDPMVLRRTKAAVGRETDPWAKAVAIQKWVFANMKDKNFSIAFAPADQVARDLQGDCTEHSVLAAAMFRAAGVPSRCVVGVAYVDNGGKTGFGPHMWNEVYVNGRWVAIDATWNESEVDATHLKFGVTGLDGVSPFETFLPVLNVFGKITIDPVEVR